MQFTDLPVTSVSAVPAMTEESLEHYVQGFTDHLEETGLIARSSLELTTRRYLQAVNYGHYALVFDDYWDSTTNKTIERIMTLGIQTASILGMRKPPAKTVLRDIAKVKVADALLTKYTK